MKFSKKKKRGGAGEEGGFKSIVEYHPRVSTLQPKKKSANFSELEGISCDISKKLKGVFVWGWCVCFVLFLFSLYAR